MKKITLLLLLIISLKCSNYEYINEYEMIGYSKNNNARVITYNIKNIKQIKRDSFPMEIIKDLTLKGHREPNTKGAITAVFFFCENQAPNISNLNTLKATEIALNNKPIAVVWNYGDGTKKTIFNPE